jgi:cap2 methyltransferase
MLWVIIQEPFTKSRYRGDVMFEVPNYSRNDNFEDMYNFSEQEWVCRFREVCKISASPHWSNPDSSPHVKQAFANPSANYQCRTDNPFERILRPEHPSMTYRRRKGEVKTVIHWGQRKLLMSEIEFLTTYAQDGYTVVYAGAAPGTHISYLSSLFPNISFDLFDPAPFSLHEVPNKIRIFTGRDGMFTDETAKRYSNRNDIFFICDVRSADWQQQSDEETESQVIQDMQNQKRWHEIIKPVKSILKFRLSWRPGQTTYLAGDIYFPVWGPITTTETRLVTSEGLHNYDNSKYEQQMFYFNTTDRVALYPHPVENPTQGLDHCYDCTAEVYILWKYLVNREHYPENSSKTWTRIAELVDEISMRISSDRKLCSPNPDPGQRKHVIKQRQWIAGKPAYEYFREFKGDVSCSDQLSSTRKRKREEQIDYNENSREFDGRSSYNEYEHRHRKLRLDSPEKMKQK